MSFGQELKDFASGFKSGAEVGTSIRKARSEERRNDLYERSLDTKEDEDPMSYVNKQYDTISSGFGDVSDWGSKPTSFGWRHGKSGKPNTGNKGNKDDKDTEDPDKINWANQNPPGTAPVPTAVSTAPLSAVQGVNLANTMPLAAYNANSTPTPTPVQTAVGEDYATEG